MKWISSLVALQLVVISILVYWVFNIEKRFEAMSKPPVQSRPMNSLHSTEPIAGKGQGPVGLDEQDLRRIIRAELSVLKQPGLGTPPATEEQEALIDPVENAFRLEAIKEELSYHIEQGEISEHDMMNLQAEIARLDPDSRTMMLRELVIALNSGQLKGQL